MIKFYARPTMECSVTDCSIGIVKGIIQDLDAIVFAQRLPTVMAHRIDFDVFIFLLSAFCAFPRHSLLLQSQIRFSTSQRDSNAFSISDLISKYAASERRPAFNSLNASSNCFFMKAIRSVFPSTCKDFILRNSSRVSQII